MRIMRGCVHGVGRGMALLLILGWAGSGQSATSSETTPQPKGSSPPSTKLSQPARTTPTAPSAKSGPATIDPCLTNGTSVPLHA